MTDSSHFQPADGTWEEYAATDDVLKSVLDPKDGRGVKNRHIDLLHKLAIDKAADIHSNHVTLDFGCGSGRITNHMATHCNFSLGVDITCPMLRLAMKNRTRSNTGFLQFNGLDLPLKDKSVDRIVSVYVLQYFVKQKDLYIKILQEFRRVLKEDGKLIFIEQTSQSNEASGSVGEASFPEDYLNIPKEFPGRLEVLTRKIIRLGSPGYFEQLLLHKLFPDCLRPLFTHFLFWKNWYLLPFPLQNQIYVDWLFSGRFIDSPK